AEQAQAAKVVSASAIARSKVVPLIFDTSLFTTLPGPELARQTFNLSPTQPLLLFLSRIHEKKGVETLLRAAAKLLPKPFTLVIAGPAESPAYLASIQSLTASLGLSDRTLFPGLVSGPLKVSLYQAATAFVLPTQQENFGFVLIESLLANTPVITTKGVDIWPELAQSGNATITDGTVDAIATALFNAIAPPRTTGPIPAHSNSPARIWAENYVDEVRIVKLFDSLYSRQSAPPQ
ncbi:MAG: glycosyltransferase, partial [bacterium]|nr:glycosyltransferase [bacterium]